MSTDETSPTSDVWTNVDTAMGDNVDSHWLAVESLRVGGILLAYFLLAGVLTVIFGELLPPLGALASSVVGGAGVFTALAYVLLRVDQRRLRT